MVLSSYTGNLPWLGYSSVVSVSAEHILELLMGSAGGNILTDSLLYLICAAFRVVFNFASFSLRCSSSSPFCCRALSICRFSISCRLFCWPLGVVWLNVLSKPPNNRRPRFFSSCALVFNLSESCFAVSSAGILRDSGSALMACGNALKAGGESALPSWDNLGRFEDTLEAEDCLRLRGGLCAARSGRTTAEDMGLC